MPYSDYCHEKRQKNIVALSLIFAILKQSLDEVFGVKGSYLCN